MTAKTLGILGGGQLGRMSAQAAHKLGIRTIILTPEENSPAAQVADETVLANYTDESALTAFAEKVDVISYEFENIPVSSVHYLKNLKAVYPDESLLDVAQNRIQEKTFLNETGINTAKWKKIRSVSDIESFLSELDSKELIIKTTRFGYDGKGQARISLNSDIQNALSPFRDQELIAEEVVDFECEISVIVARDQTGAMQTYGPVMNEHKNHILHKTTFPAPIDPAVAEKSVEMTKTLAKAVNLVGVLALELFVTKDGRLLANEIAPRTHNSGHWSIDACTVSQFENHVRTVCGLPALPPEPHHSAVMINLIGDDVNDIARYEAMENAHVHLYGKTEIIPGRKMGHVTILGEKL